MLQTEVLWKAPVVTTATRFKFEIKMKSSKVTSHKTFLYSVPSHTASYCDRVSTFLFHVPDVSLRKTTYA